MAAAGFARMTFSIISGLVFFAAYAADWNMQPFWYSLAYNASTIGAETVLCVIVALLPPFKKAVERIRKI
jgi:thiamine transporter